MEMRTTDGRRFTRERRTPKQVNEQQERSSSSSRGIEEQLADVEKRVNLLFEKTKAGPSRKRRWDAESELQQAGKLGKLN